MAANVRPSSARHTKICFTTAAVCQSGTRTARSLLSPGSRRSRGCAARGSRRAAGRSGSRRGRLRPSPSRARRVVSAWCRASAARPSLGDAVDLPTGLSTAGTTAVDGFGTGVPALAAGEAGRHAARLQPAGRPLTRAGSASARYRHGGEFGVVGKSEDEHLVVRRECGRHTGGTRSGSRPTFGERGAGDQASCRAVRRSGRRTARPAPARPRSRRRGTGWSGRPTIRPGAERSRHDGEVSAGTQRLGQDRAGTAVGIEDEVAGTRVSGDRVGGDSWWDAVDGAGG